MRFETPIRDQLYPTMSAAFADYQVDTTYMTEDRLLLRMVKNAVDWEASVGAFVGERMVGFTMVGIDDFGGELSAYDAVTGIVPEYRGQALASRMFDHILPGLRDRGVRRFVLEVLQPNEAAIRAYRKVGFEIQREFDCFEIDPAKMVDGESGESAYMIESIPRSVVHELSEFADWLPSFENRFSALDFIEDEVICLGVMEEGRCLGALAYYPTLNWILTLVVRPENRRHGVGKSLLRALPSHLPEGTHIVRLINVAREDEAMLALAEQCGFSMLVSQYEMHLRLDS